MAFIFPIPDIIFTPINLTPLFVFTVGGFFVKRTKNEPLSVNEKKFSPLHNIELVSFLLDLSYGMETGVS